MAHRLTIVATNRNELQSVRTGSILGTELATNIVVSSQPMESAGAMEEDHAALHEMAQKYLEGVAPTDWEVLRRHQRAEANVQKIDVPTYPFHRKRYS